ncbi:hypothetical protein [Actinomadura parmotrematis]|uniref:GNAT family N-acetyltransferase n=1 Tax=Actinomadura parmotrematis TaxID=2864039 RepID=A0ABS7FLC0_9ACTN|nr:hypothetical protein [Actinomadura parmotrematis]MBW8481173.1 hypothetical protein [Actinomadura parmotrematis]
MVKGVAIEIHPLRGSAGPAGWAGFARSADLGPLWAHEVLRGLAEPPGAPLLLAVARDGDGICAALCGAPARTVPFGPTVLDVRLPGQAHGPAWRFAPRVPDGRRRDLLRAAERAAVRSLGPRCAGAAYRHVTGGALPLVARRGARVRRSLDAAAMRLPGSAEEWLASLRKSRRTDLRRQVRLVDADAGLKVEAGAARTDLDPDLLAALHHRHSGRRASRLDPRAPLPAAYFAALCGREDVVTVSYREAPSGRLLAFGVLVDHAAAPQSTAWASLAPEEGGRKHLYFDHFVRLMRHVTRHAGAEFGAGQGMAEVKASLGFAPVPMWTVLAPRLPGRR